MSDVSEIRPAYPIAPVKRRERETTDEENRSKHRPKPKPKRDRVDRVEDDSQPPLIDEYV